MMYYQFSKLSKAVIIINIIVSLVLAIFFVNLFIKSLESEEIIKTFMQENDVIREEAIRKLNNQGEELYVGSFTVAYIGFTSNLAAIIALIWYSRTNSILSAFMSAFICVFTNFIGGMLLFYMFFSKRREVKQDSGEYKPETDFGKFIHNRIIEEEKHV